MQQLNRAPNSWDDFQARQIAKEADEAVITQPGRRRGAGKASPALGTLLLEAIQVGGLDQSGEARTWRLGLGDIF